MTGYRWRRHRLDNLRGLWFRHYRFRSEETALGRFFLYLHYLHVNLLLLVRHGQPFCLSELGQRFGIAFAACGVLRLFKQLFHLLPFLAYLF